MKKIFLYLAVISMAAAGCTSDTTNDQANRLPHSIGNMGELIVVGDNNIFKGTVRDALDSILDVRQPYIFSEEGYFRLRDISPALFRNVSKSYHTIWIIKVEGDGLSTKLLPAPYNTLSDSLSKINDTVPVRTYLKKDVWAYPQQVLFIFAKSNTDLYNYLWQNRDALRQKTLDMEMQSHMQKMRDEKSDSIAAKIQEHFGFTLAVPVKDIKLEEAKKQNFRVAKYVETDEKHKFMWIRRETNSISQGLLIYTRPYESERQLTPESIVLNRDSVVKPNIIGPADGCYMGTELTFPFTTQIMQFNDMYSVEMRAWWKTYNCFMGGPFYSITMVDEKHGVLLTVEGFVHSPEYDKTQYIRQLEAIIKTFQWAN